jgi:competence protein ComGC
MNYVIVACIATILISVFENILKIVAPQKALLWAILAIILIIMVQNANYKVAVAQQSDNKALVDTIKSLQAINISIKSKLESTSNQLEMQGNILKDIRTAMQKSNFRYDSINLRIVSIAKSQFYMPHSTFNAPVQQGNGNTQNN